MKKIFNGFKIEKKECIKKLLTRQLGDPWTLFNQVIDNLMDDYCIRNIEMDKRYLLIKYHSDTKITLSNKCQGFTEEELTALVTVGGTTKKNVRENIYGIHGIGMLSAVNPDFVSELYITFYYIPESTFKKIEFIWENDDLFYLLSEVGKNQYDFTCEYTIMLKNRFNIGKVDSIIKKQIRYLPSPSFINGYKIQNDFKRSLMEKSDHCHHIAIQKEYFGWNEYVILYNYKYIRSFHDTADFLHGGHNKTNSLDEHIDGFFYSHSPIAYNPIVFPFVKGLKIICNSSNLSLTMSKEGFYLDYNYFTLQQFLRLSLLEFLDNKFHELDVEDILSNVYIFRNKIREYLNSQTNISEDDYEKLFVSKLAEKKIFAIFNTYESYSLKEIFDLMKDSGKPLFYSIEGNNLNFASGRFSHDFVLTLPDKARITGTSDFYDKILTAIFTDVVNLDSIFDNPTTINKLVERGIVNREDVYPRVKFHSLRDLRQEEYKFIKEIEEFFNRKPIIRIIERVLLMKIRFIRIGLFDVVNGDQLVLNASFFDDKGNFLLDDHVSNIIKVTDEPDKKSRWILSGTSLKLFIGLNRCSAELSYVIRNSSNQPVEYSLMAICNQLVSTQKYISADTATYYRLKNYLSEELWSYILNQ